MEEGGEGYGMTDMGGEALLPVDAHEKLKCRKRNKKKTNLL
jgi:hypothetical protein